MYYLRWIIGSMNRKRENTRLPMQEALFNGHIDCCRMLLRFDASPWHTTKILPEGPIPCAPQAGVPTIYPRLVTDEMKVEANDRALIFGSSVDAELARLGGPGSVSSRRPRTALSALTVDTLTGERVKYYWALHRPMDAIVTSLLGEECLGSDGFFYQEGWQPGGRHRRTTRYAVELHEVCLCNSKRELIVLTVATVRSANLVSLLTQQR